MITLTITVKMFFFALLFNSFFFMAVLVVNVFPYFTSNETSVREMSAYGEQFKYDAFECLHDRFLIYIFYQLKKIKVFVLYSDNELIDFLF